MCENGSIITDGGDIIGIRQLEEAGPPTRVVLDPANSICPGLLEVCCRNEDFFEQPILKNGEKSKDEVCLNKFLIIYMLKIFNVTLNLNSLNSW